MGNELNLLMTQTSDDTIELETTSENANEVEKTLESNT